MNNIFTRESEANKVKNYFANFRELDTPLKPQNAESKLSYYPSLP